MLAQQKYAGEYWGCCFMWGVVQFELDATANGCLSIPVTDKSARLFSAVWVVVALARKKHIKQLLFLC